MIRWSVVVAALLLGVGACGSSGPDESRPAATPTPSAGTTPSDFCTAWSDLPGRGAPVSGVETPGTPPDQAAIRQYAALVDLAPPEIAGDVRALASTAGLGSSESIKKFAAANARVTAWVEQSC